MPNQTNATRGKFQAIKRIYIDAIGKLDKQEIAANQAGDTKTRDALIVARQALEQNLREVSRAEAEFLLSKASLADLTQRLTGVRNDAQRALKKMKQAEEALKQATLLLKILEGLVTLMT